MSEPEQPRPTIMTLPGSNTPADPLEPHLPGVDVLADMPALFAKARG